MRYIAAEIPVSMELDSNTIFSISILILNAILLLFAVGLIVRAIIGMRRDRNSNHKEIIQ